MSAILGSTPIGTILMTLISFILVIYIVYKFAWLPIDKILKERQAQITKDIDEAHRLKETSQQEIAESKKEVEKALTQAQELVNNAKAHGQEMADKVIEEANLKAEGLIEKTNADLNRQRRQFHHEMEESVINISVMMAQKVLQREITEADHREYIHEFINRLDAEFK